jgi:aryl-alcohol dehydrogenase-like predicted oxidoreductase
MVKKRVLGRTGFQISELGLGAWPLGGAGSTMNYGSVTDEEAISVLEAYVEAGGNFIDTARLYNESERIIGEFLKKRGKREDLVIATKSAAGGDRDTIGQIRKDLETSLGLMGIDYVDVLQLHQPPGDPEIMQLALDEMLNLKEEGKIRATGASIKGVDVTEMTETLCRQYIQTGKVDALQIVYSILRQRHGKIIEEAKNAGVGIIARTALESGILTGKYKPGQTFGEGDQRSRYKPASLEFVLKAAEDLQDFAVRPPYQNLAEVAIKFALEPQGVSTLIFGAHRPENVKRNMKTAELPPLDVEVLKRLKEQYGGVTDKANYF